MEEGKRLRLISAGMICPVYLMTEIILTLPMVDRVPRFRLDITLSVTLGGCLEF
jgi:hypothetical protein